MSIKVPNAAERWMLNKLFDRTGAAELFNPTSVKYRLATTIPPNGTINHNAMQSSDITEASFPGYTSGGIIATGWQDAVTLGTTDDDYYAVTSGDWVSFTKDTDDSTVNTIDGYYVTDIASGKLMWFEVVSSPVLSVENSGDSISILERFTLHSEF
jgi:hypothetical protein